MGLRIIPAIAANSGYAINHNSVYIPVHGAAIGSAVITSTVHIRNSHHVPAVGDFSVSRGFHTVDTSILGGIGVVTARVVLMTAKFSSVPEYEWQAVLHVVEGIQNIPLVNGDYGAHLGQTTSGGSVVYLDIGDRHYRLPPSTLIVLNATGIGWIDPSGLTKFCLRLSGDINSLEPEHGNAVVSYGRWDWSPAETKLASAITQSSATLNATFHGLRGLPPVLEVTYIGANPTYPRVRFQWGETVAYGNDTPWQYGIPLLTDFLAGISGLTLDTTYHFRVQYEDELGYINGDDKSFTTLLVPPVPFAINRAYALSREEL